MKTKQKIVIIMFVYFYSPLLISMQDLAFFYLKKEQQNHEAFFLRNRLIDFIFMNQHLSDKYDSLSTLAWQMLLFTHQHDDGLNPNPKDVLTEVSKVTKQEYEFIKKIVIESIDLANQQSILQAISPPQPNIVTLDDQTEQ